MRAALLFLTAAAAAHGLCPSARAAFVAFDELPTRPLDGASVNGVTFGFTVRGAPSTDATFNTTAGPGAVPGLFSPPNAEGDSAGVLTIAFDRPVTRFSFGVALNTFGPQPEAAIVSLFAGAAVPAGGFTVVGAPGPTMFTVGRAEYVGEAVTRAVVTFNVQPANRFAIDGLEFTPAVVPEPATLGAFALVGLCGLAARLRRRAA